MFGGGVTPEPQNYSITQGDYVTLYSVTTDGTYGQSVTTKVTEAAVGDTVTFAYEVLPGYSPTVQTAGGVTVTDENVGTFQIGEPPAPTTTCVVKSFTMPPDDVVIDTEI